MAPGVASTGQYFNKKRGAAMGIAVAGSSLGGVIFPYVSNFRSVSAVNKSKNANISILASLSTRCSTTQSWASGGQFEYVALLL